MTERWKSMPYPNDFYDAHRRHLDDADTLFELDRFANADHLYGLSAECGLKSVMQRERMVDGEGTGALERKYWQHLPKLWGLFVDFVSERPGALLSDELRDRDPFSIWSIDDRYANTRHFQRRLVEPHRDAAQRIHDMCRRARLG